MRVQQPRAGRPAQRQVVCLMLVPGERDADDLGPARPDVRRFRIDGNLPLPPHLGHERFQRLGRVDGRVDRRHVSGTLRVPLASDGTRSVPNTLSRSASRRKPNSSNSARAWAGSPPPDRAERQGIAIGTHVSSFTSCAAHKGLLAILLEVLLLGRAADFLDVGQDVVQRAVFFQQIAGRLGADQRHARHVVGRVAHQGLVIDDLIGPDAPFLPQAVAVHDLVLADVVELDAISDQLPAVLVAGDDVALPAQFVGDPGDRGDNVVGLETLVGQQGNAQGLDHAMYEGDLRLQVLVHLRPPGLVLLIELVAKRLARQVERAEEEVGLFGLQQAEQVAGEAIDGIDRLPAGAGHVGNGMEHLVDQRMGIDDPDRLPGKARGQSSRHPRRVCRPLELCSAHLSSAWKQVPLRRTRMPVDLDRRALPSGTCDNEEAGLRHATKSSASKHDTPSWIGSICRIRNENQWS